VLKSPREIRVVEIAGWRLIWRVEKTMTVALKF
jgi:hypothetical protein